MPIVDLLCDQGDDFEGEELEEYPRAEEKSSGDNRRGAKGGGK